MLLVLLVVGCGPAPTPADDPAGYAGPDARAFVEKHRAELEAEIAVGSGQTIYNLAILADCQDVPQLSRRLHRRQAQLFAPEFAPEGNLPGSEHPGSDVPGSDVQRSDAVVGSPVGAGNPSGAGAQPSDAVVAARIVQFMEESREFRCQSLDRTRTRRFAAGTRHVGPRRGATTARGGTP